MILNLSLGNNAKKVPANLLDPVFLRLANGNIIAGGVLAKDDGKHIAGSARIQLWNSDLSKKLKQTEPELYGIKYISQLHGNGNLVIVDGEGKPSLVKQDLSKAPNHSRFNPNSVITSLTVLKSGDKNHRILMGVKEDNSFRLEIWSADLRNRLETAVLGTDENAKVTSLIQLNNSYIVSGAYNGTLQLWNSNLNKIGSSIESQQREILSLAQLDSVRLDNGDLTSGELISGSRDGTLRRWRVINGGLTAFHLPFPAYQSNINILLALKSNLISGGSNGVLKSWKWEKDVSANDASKKTSEDNVVVMVTPHGGGEIYRLTKTGSTDYDYNLQFGSAGKKPRELIRTRLEGQLISPILSLLLLTDKDKDKDLVTGHQDGSVQRWKYNPKDKVWLRVGDAYRPNASLEIPGIWSMAELHNGDVVLGTNNAFMLLLRFKGGKWFKQGEPCRPPFTKVVPDGSLGDRISSLATLDDGDLVSGSSNGTIVRWQSPGKQWCKVGPIVLGKESVPIFSMTQLFDGTMLSATDKGGLTMWRWRGQAPSQTKEEIATIHWKDPGQQIASVAALPEQRGLVVADFTGRSKIYPDRNEAIRLGCEALRLKFKESYQVNPGNQARKPFENEARNVCREFTK